MKFEKRLSLAATLLLAVGSLTMTGCNSSSSISSVAVAGQSEQDTVISELSQGNAEFQNGKFTTLAENSTMARVQELAKNGQKPLTIVLTCSDSRVPPEIIFNKGVGELFVIRVAGNVIDKDQLGSIEYAIEHIKSPVVLMVLGHSKCGAVKSTAEAVKSGAAIDAASNLGGILAKIKPAVDISFKNYTGLDRLVDHAVDENVKLVAEDMKVRSTIIEEAIKLGHVKLVQYRYDIDNGKVTSVQ